MILRKPPSLQINVNFKKKAVLNKKNSLKDIAYFNESLDLFNL